MLFFSKSQSHPPKTTDFQRVCGKTVEGLCAISGKAVGDAKILYEYTVDKSVERVKKMWICCGKIRWMRALFNHDFV
jgi:hypothetical protein